MNINWKRKSKNFNLKTELKKLQNIEIELKINCESLFALIMLIEKYIRKFNLEPFDEKSFRLLSEKLKSEMVIRYPESQELLNLLKLEADFFSDEKELGFNDLSLVRQTILAESRIVNTMLILELAKHISESEEEILYKVAEEATSFIASNYSIDKIKKSVLEMETILKENRKT